jgi:hypothetical protein
MWNGSYQDLLAPCLCSSLIELSSDKKTAKGKNRLILLIPQVLLRLFWILGSPRLSQIHSLKDTSTWLSQRKFSGFYILQWAPYLQSLPMST